ncbi:hypothetical protein BB560_005466 [Smittium megazygosporum]|uniref:Uncharacterized protein n=1 Tax=Smittium megazygosporum TaxID=133381 RepID=A0A2T9Z526_9FUNG|nr:hypothetical protein BB560_005466 [Smittium megazygosporum]
MESNNLVPTSKFLLWNIKFMSDQGKILEALDLFERFSHFSKRNISSVKPVYKSGLFEDPQTKILSVVSKSHLGTEFSEKDADFKFARHVALTLIASCVKPEFSLRSNPGLRNILTLDGLCEGSINKNHLWKLYFSLDLMLDFYKHFPKIYHGLSGSVLINKLLKFSIESRISFLKANSMLIVPGHNFDSAQILKNNFSFIYSYSQSMRSKKVTEMNCYSCLILLATKMGIKMNVDFYSTILSGLTKLVELNIYDMDLESALVAFMGLKPNYYRTKIFKPSGQISNNQIISSPHSPSLQNKIYSNKTATSSLTFDSCTLKKSNDAFFLLPEQPFQRYTCLVYYILRNMDHARIIPDFNFALNALPPLLLLMKFNSSLNEIWVSIIKSPISDFSSRRFSSLHSNPSFISPETQTEHSIQSSEPKSSVDTLERTIHPSTLKDRVDRLLSVSKVWGAEVLIKEWILNNMPEYKV